MISGVFRSKTKLTLINEIITIKKMIHSGINNYFKNLGATHVCFNHSLNADLVLPRFAHAYAFCKHKH